MNNKEFEILKLEIQSIKERNSKVEINKAWEVSKTRILFICLITYLVAVTYIYLVRNRGIWLSALIPVIGFYLSTQSLPIVKRFWIKTQQNSQ